MDISESVRLFCEDCMQGMKRIPDESIDMVLCDLPYGVLNRSNKSAGWDEVIPPDLLWKEYTRIVKSNGAIVLFAQGMFTAQLMMSNVKMWRYNLIWQKGGRCTGFLNAKRMPLREHEDICVFYRRQPVYHPQMKQCAPHQRNHSRGHTMSVRNRCYGEFAPVQQISSDLKYPKSVLNFPKEHDKFYHPTQKPVALLEYLIRTYSSEGDTILDNCMGSGSTGVACINTQRRFIGFELNQDYYNIALQRCQDAASL